MDSVKDRHYDKKIKAQAVGRQSWQRIILLAVLGFEGAGAILGGILLIAAPDGRYMDMPVGIMRGVFDNFFLPGLILLALGILNASAFISVYHRKLNDWIMAGLALGGLLTWFIVEIIILQELHWLHAMWGLPVLLGWVVAIPLIAFRNKTALIQKALPLCGILSSLWYIAINIYVPMQDDGYLIASYTVSELSAIDAPTRIFWVLLVVVYPLLFSAFGWGVLQAANGNHHLRLVGSLMIAYSIFNFYWPPMHLRGVEPTLADTLHIVWAMVINIFMWLFMGFGAAASGKGFRLYSIVSIALHIVFGSLATLEATNIPGNNPTPMIGIWERINIFIFMLWVIVFSIKLLRKEGKLNYQTPSELQP